MPDQEQAEGFYGPLGESLSQGDIVRVVPTGFIDQPLTVCQPNNKEPEGKAYYGPPSMRFKPPRYLHASGEIGLAMVVWPDCQIDKLKEQNRPEKDWIVGVAQIRPLSSLSDKSVAANLAEKIFGFQRAQWFPVASNPPHWEAGFVDLRYIWTVRYGLLQDRAAALNDEIKRALQLHLFWFQTEAKIQTVNCPQCDALLDGSMLLKFKQPDDEQQNTQGV